jgi:hypothetical protein
MAKTFRYMNHEETQVEGVLETEQDRHGYMPPPSAKFPFKWTIGMSPSNQDFDQLFPNAVTRVDPVSNTVVLVEHGEPAFPIAKYEAPPEPVPMFISDRQFFWGLYKKTMITKDQAMAAIKQGTTPPLIVKILAGIPNMSDRDDTEALIMGAKEIQRNNKATADFGHAVGMDDAAIDDFFRYCNTL